MIDSEEDRGEGSRHTLRTMTLRSRLSAESAIVVHTPDKVVDNELAALAVIQRLEVVQPSEQAQRRHKNVREAGIALAKLVTGDRAVLPYEREENCVSALLNDDGIAACQVRGEKHRTVTGDGGGHGKGNSHFTTRSTSHRSSASCIMSTCNALSVAWICASCPG